jgi:hypothetical protein
MQKGFLFDGVQVKHAGIPVNQAIQFPVSVFADAARAAFSTGNVTLPGAKGTLDLASVEGLEKGRDLRLYEPLLWCLGRAAFGKKEEVTCTEGTKAAPTNLEKLAFCEAALQKAITLANAVAHVSYLRTQERILSNMWIELFTLKQ